MGSKRNRQAEEVYALSPTQLEETLTETRRQLFTLRFQHATRQLENTSQVGKVRRQVARLRTVQRQRQLAAAEE